MVLVQQQESAGLMEYIDSTVYIAWSAIETCVVGVGRRVIWITIPGKGGESGPPLAFLGPVHTPAIGIDFLPREQGTRTPGTGSTLDELAGRAVLIFGSDS